MVGVGVDVRHAAAQAGLQLGRMPLEEVHDRRPGDAGKHRPGVVADGRAIRRHGDARKSVSGLDGQPRQRKHDARKYVDDNLLVDARDLARALPPLAKDDVATEETGDEAIVGACRRVSAGV